MEKINIDVWNQKQYQGNKYQCSKPIPKSKKNYISIVKFEMQSRKRKYYYKFKNKKNKFRYVNIWHQNPYRKNTFFGFKPWLHENMFANRLNTFLTIHERGLEEKKFQWTPQINLSVLYIIYGVSHRVWTLE